MISEQLKKIFTEAARVCVLTGAGISAESGVPTFRGGGNTAVWKGMRFDQISSAQMVREDLEAVWEWFDYRRGVLKSCEPNSAHLTLAAWQNRFLDFTLVTQNIDGLHRAAGSKNVIELHGNINRARCEKCERKIELKREQSGEERPRACDVCGGRFRPDVVLFGEMLPTGAFETAAVKAAESELFFVVGTSALVYPAAGLPEIAKNGGAFVVEVNPEETSLTDFCDASLRGKAGEILPLFN